MAAANSHAYESGSFQRTYQVWRCDPGSAGHLDLDDNRFERVLGNILTVRFEIFQVGLDRLSDILKCFFF